MDVTEVEQALLWTIKNSAGASDLKTIELFDKLNVTEESQIIATPPAVLVFVRGESFELSNYIGLNYGHNILVTLIIRCRNYRSEAARREGDESSIGINRILRRLQFLMRGPLLSPNGQRVVGAGTMILEGTEFIGSSGGTINYALNMKVWGQFDPDMEVID